MKKSSLLAFVFSASLAVADEQKPNILWVVTDDQRLDSIQAFNRMTTGKNNSRLGKVMSPNVDRLAKMGTTFINTFNQNPSCAPCRTSMSTGRYSHRTGVYGFEYYNPKGMAHWRPMVPEILRDEAGYQTVTAGKKGIRYIAGKKKAGGSSLYQIDLGYRREFASKGLVDWNKVTEWKTKKKRESFYFPDGQILVWPGDPTEAQNDRDEIAKKLDLFRKYGAQDGGKASYSDGLILGGVNSQPGDKTRDGSFVAALSRHLDHSGGKYKTMLGEDLAGPDPGKPLFMYCGFDFPHTPVLPPKEFRDQFRNVKYEIPKVTKKELEGFPSQIKKLLKNAGSDHFTEEEKQGMVADYFAFCAYGDSLVGKMVKKFVDYSEKSKRPWMVLYVCGDHGWRLNEHGMISKFGPFDTDLHNPAIVVSSDKKRFPAGKVVTDFTCFVDFAPTFYGAAGIDTSKPKYAYLDGEDLADVVGGKVAPRDYIIAEPNPVTGPRGVIRTGDYKFTMKMRPKRINGKKIDWALTADLQEIEPMFFDLRVDPDEVSNLAFDPYYRPVIDQMRKKLQDILLGDGRVECKWSREPGGEVVTSNFAPGADDGKLKLVELKPKDFGDKKK